jgi:carbon starvation protein
VGYLGSTGEGLLALVTILAVSAGFASLAEWEATYSAFGVTGIDTFVTGGSRIVEAGTGLSREFAATLLAVMAVLFAGTTMDAGVRLQRYIVQEWGTIYNIPVLQNGYIATFIAVAACLALAFGAGGADGQGGMLIWPLFGTTNQLLAGMTLLVISIMLVKLRRRYIFTLAPMVFVTGMAFLAAVYQLWDLFKNGQFLLAGVDILIIIAAIFVILEASAAFSREKRAAAASV